MNQNLPYGINYYLISRVQNVQNVTGKDFKTKIRSCNRAPKTITMAANIDYEQKTSFRL